MIMCVARGEAPDQRMCSGHRATVQVGSGVQCWHCQSRRPVSQALAA